MQIRTVAVLGAGEMGSAVAKRLLDGGCAVVVSLEGRSDASRCRVTALGIPTVETVGEAVAHGNLVLSIVPPAEALAAAHLVRSALRAAPRPLTYVDCNAVSPATAKEIEAIVRSADAAFVDAGIIGAPPRLGEAGPIIFVSGRQLAPVFDLREAGLEIRGLGTTVGSASALKLSYAGITKGLTALCALMQLQARAHGLGAELDAVLQETRPDLWHFLERAVPGMYPKAYRWIAEMREIAVYASPDEAGERIYEGAARFYEQVAREAAVKTNSSRNFQSDSPDGANTAACGAIRRPGGLPPVDSHEPAITSSSPAIATVLNDSPSRTTPSSAATAGFR
jgi:3-hydroxyisobutyrate dehydrogenase-like beta-hydroxyacid dehydrogenase